MNEKGKSPEVGKSESPEDFLKLEVGSRKSEKENNSTTGIPNSEIL